MLHIYRFKSYVKWESIPSKFECFHKCLHRLVTCECHYIILWAILKESAKLSELSASSAQVDKSLDSLTVQVHSDQVLFECQAPQVLECLEYSLSAQVPFESFLSKKSLQYYWKWTPQWFYRIFLKPFRIHILHNIDCSLLA